MMFLLSLLCGNCPCFKVNTKQTNKKTLPLDRRRIEEE